MPFERAAQSRTATMSAMMHLIACGECDYLPGFPAVPCSRHAQAAHQAWLKKRADLMAAHGYTAEQADKVQMGWDPNRKDPAVRWFRPQPKK